MFKHIVFVFNPLSGNANRISTELGKLKKILIQNYPDFHFQDCSLLSDELNLLITNLTHEKCLFVACGGDGTVAAVAEKIYLIPNFCLTVFPFGTGNDFSRAIGVFDRCYDLEELAQIYVGKKARKIDFDMWEINGRLFLNYFTIGYDAAVVTFFQNLRHKMPKILRRPFFNRVLYLISGICHLFYSIPMGTMLQYEGNEIGLFGYKSIVLGNINSYAGGKHLSPSVVYSDLKLNVFKVEGIREELQLIIGKGIAVMVATNDSFDLILENAVNCQVDGEPFLMPKGKHSIRYFGKLGVLGV